MATTRVIRLKKYNHDVLGYGDLLCWFFHPRNYKRFMNRKLRYRSLGKKVL